MHMMGILVLVVKGDRLEGLQPESAQCATLHFNLLLAFLSWKVSLCLGILQVFIRSQSFSPIHANMMSVAALWLSACLLWKQARDAGSLLTCGNFWALRHVIGMQLRIRINILSHILFREGVVRGTTETRRVSWKYHWHDLPRAKNLLFLKRETESHLGAMQQLIWETLKEKKAWQRGLVICGSFSWQRGELCGEEWLCECMSVKTEKLSSFKLQHEHKYDCWHCCFCSGTRNHIRWFRGAPWDQARNV